LLPPTVLWGASFPLALAAAAAPTDRATTAADPARLVARVYAANTLGAIVGAAGFGLFVIGSLGTRRGEQLLVLLPVAGALLLLAPAVAAGGRRGAWAGAGLVASVGAAVALALGVADVPPGVIGYGRFLPYMTNRGLPVFLYAGEGRNSSIAVSVF